MKVSSTSEGKRKKDYSIQDLLALGVDPVYIDSSVDYDYYAMLNNAVLLKKIDVGRKYTVKACYKTLNLYQNQQYANHTIRWL